jgi:hypothetical protein
MRTCWLENINEERGIMRSERIHLGDLGILIYFGLSVVGGIGCGDKKVAGPPPGFSPSVPEKSRPPDAISHLLDAPTDNRYLGQSTLMIMPDHCEWNSDGTGLRCDE